MKINLNKRGSALIVTIIVLVVASILITAVLALNQSDNRKAIYQERRTQAQYLARAGADAAAKYVQDNSPQFDPDVFSTPLTINNTDLGEGTFSAVISKPFTGSIVVQSTGVVKDVSETVNVSLVRGDYTGLFRGIWQTGYDSLDLGALGITYEPGSSVLVEANTNDLNNITLSANNPNNTNDPNIVKTINNDSAGAVQVPSSIPNGTIVEETEIDPVTLEEYTTKTITGDSFFNSLVTENKDTLVFNTDTCDEQIIVVNNLVFTGPQTTVEVRGDGAVHLFITSSGAMDTPLNINSGSPAKLFIYVAEGATLALQANCELDGYIYGPDATIEIQSDDTTINGAIIGNIIQRNTNQGPHGSFNFVPLPDGTDFSGLIYYTRSYYSN